MSAKAKISKVANLFYTTAVVSAVIGYFAVQSQTLTGTLFGLVLSLGFTFVVSRLLLGGSSFVRKIVLFCNVAAMGLVSLGMAASVLSSSSSPLRSIVAIGWLGWSFLLHFRSFTTLKDSDVKRMFA